MKVKVGSSWKDAKNVKIKVGSSYEDAKVVWIKVGGVWKRSYHGNSYIQRFYGGVGTIGRDTVYGFSIDSVYGKAFGIKENNIDIGGATVSAIVCSATQSNNFVLLSRKLSTEYLIVETPTKVKYTFKSLSGSETYVLQGSNTVYSQWFSEIQSTNGKQVSYKVYPK